MSDMIERVALAAWIAYAVRDEELDSAEDGDYNRASAIRDWNEYPRGCTHMGADGFRHIARKVVEAMREPTGAMVKPVADDIADLRFEDPNAAAIGFWQAMIDEALKPA